MVKFTVELASLILALKHILRYRLINKPRITSDFWKQYSPKFNDNQRITDTDICIFLHICVYSFHMCITRFGAYPSHLYIYKNETSFVGRLF
jgi:hypothetical protein